MPAEKNRSDEKQQTSKQTPMTGFDERRAEVNNSANTTSGSQTQKRETEDETFKAEQLRQNRIISKATIYIAVFGGLSFLAALIYAVVSIYQLQAIKSQAKATREEFERSHRPWVSLKSSPEVVGTIGYDEAGPHARVRFTLINAGTAPAIGTVINAYLVMESDWNPDSPKHPACDLKNLLDIVKERRGGDLIVPNLEIRTSQTRPSEKMISLRDPKAVDSKAPLLLIGCVGYYDESVWDVRREYPLYVMGFVERYVHETNSFETTGWGYSETKKEYGKPN